MRLIGIATMLMVAANVHAQEMADHPLITRYPGSEITWREVQEHQPYRIAVGPVTGYRSIEKWEEVAGRVTRINYDLPGERSMFEVYSNYLEALKKSGFMVLAEGYSKESSVKGEVGHRGFLNVAYAANAFPPGASDLTNGSSTSGGSGYVAARLERTEGVVHVVVGTAQYREDIIVTVVDIIEGKAMETDRITVDADAMSKEIDSTGRTVLHGLFFDHDKATLTAESKPALEGIAKLLQQRAELNAYVVGHTDSSGSLDYNLKLSRDRAQAVVDALTQEHGIGKERLEAHGVGPLCPAASNGGDAGKTANRRVELVER